MAVTSEISAVEYSGNGATTVFPTTFRFNRPEHLTVRVDGQLRTLGLHYTVTGAGLDAGGNVTFLIAPALAAVVTIERTVPVTQEVSFTTQGTFDPRVHERAFDLGTMVDQQLDRRIKALESGGLPETATAGDGLVPGGGAWHVGAGAGIVVSADEVAVAFGAGLPTSLDANNGTAGVADQASRADHRHRVLVGVPTTQEAGASPIEGTSTALARADHVHETPCGPPVAVRKGDNQEGSSAAFARSDHVHDVATASAVGITDGTSSEGASSSLARADHQHAHGARGGGDLHAAATTGTAGFMSPADKRKLVDQAHATSGAVSTESGAPTVVAAIVADIDAVFMLEAMVVGRRGSGNEGAGFLLAGTFRRNDGVLVQVGATTAIATHRDNAAWTAAFAVSGHHIQVVVTGVAAVPIDWVAHVRYALAKGG